MTSASFKIAGLCLILSWLASCGGQIYTPSDEEFIASAPAAAPRALRMALDTSALGSPAPGTSELVRNGAFTDGGVGWSQVTNRSDWGTAGSIIGALPAGVPAPGNGQTTVARLCGFATESISGLNRSAGTCNDRLSTTLTVPAGTRNLTLRATAYGSYACAGDLINGGLHGAFVMGLRPLDGLGNALPSVLQVKEVQTSNQVHLPPGSWQDLELSIDSVPGLEAQERQFTLFLMFSTAGGCKPPADINTYVLLTDISARVDR